MMLLILILFALANLAKPNDEIPLLQQLVLPNLAENQTVRLNCALIQGKDVTLTWYFNGQKIEESSRIRIKNGYESADLIIKNLQIDDQGRYKCQAFNHLAKDEKEIDLYFPSLYYHNYF